jgi:hypothetical protein
MGSSKVPAAPVIAGHDVGAAVVSRRRTSPWMRLPTSPKTPLSRLSRAASSSLTLWRRHCARAQIPPLSPSRLTRCWTSLPPSSSRPILRSHRLPAACLRRVKLRCGTLRRRPLSAQQTMSRPRRRPYRACHLCWRALWRQRRMTRLFLRSRLRRLPYEAHQWALWR